MFFGNYFEQKAGMILHEYFLICKKLHKLYNQTPTIMIYR